MEGVEFEDCVYVLCMCRLCVCMHVCGHDEGGASMHFQVWDETWENHEHIACVAE